MNFEVTDNSLNNISADGVVVAVFENEKSKAFEELDKILDNLLSKTVKIEDFKPKLGSSITIYAQDKLLSPLVFVLGLGKKEELDTNKLRKATASLVKNIRNRFSCIALEPLSASDSKIDIEEQVQAMLEGFLLGSYSFNKYKKEESKKNLETIIISDKNKNNQAKINNAISLAKLYSDATKLARDLVNEQSAVATPTFLAKVAQDIAKSSPSIKCEVYDKNQLEKMGMNAFLGVAQASETPPKFIYLEYTPKNIKNKKKLAIVGKGITFDSGGINVKPGDSMKTMKLDMAGAAAVLGIFSVISHVSPDIQVMGLIAATPNLISGKSIVPGDVVKALNGKTIEILNTDAEGRVTMADSLSFAAQKGATEIIDLATLTGACEVALGTDIAGLFGRNEEFNNKIKKASISAGEKVWELPLEEDYKDLNKSDTADIANIPSSRYGGAITAALFLEEFVGNKIWAHLDIAGPAFSEKPYDLGPKGGTGFGVRTILNFLKEE